MERACRLPNTTHSEVASSLPLPSFPAAFGSDEPVMLEVSGRPVAEALTRPDVLIQAPLIARLLADVDAAELDLRECRAPPLDPSQRSWLYQDILRHNPEAFSCISSQTSLGQIQDQSSRCPETEKSFERSAPSIFASTKDSDIMERKAAQSHPTHVTPKKPKVRKKGDPLVDVGSEISDHQDIISTFCEMAEELIGNADIPDDTEGSDWSSIPLADLMALVNEITSIRLRKLMHAVPLDILTRLINVLDRQVQSVQGISINSNEDPDLDVETLVFSGLESTHAALAVMTHHEMPKQLYREESIERILEFTRHQILDCISVSNPSFYGLHKPTENGTTDGFEDDDDEGGDGSASKKRRNVRSVNNRKSTAIKFTSAVNTVVQKLCVIMGFLKDLLTVVHLSDSCILQLVKTSFSTFLVDNMQLLQLKSINLICEVHASYIQHRSFLIDETLQLLRKLQFSKRAIRTYHLPDEEQKQIQMITALLIQLVQFSVNVPDGLKSTVNWSTIIDASIDSSYPVKCHEAVTEACCQFWTSLLQRVTTAKAQDISEAKSILDNLVTDLLTTLNLPEFPAAATILEVLCVLLLQNAGLKSKDTSARCLAIDLLGTIAARLRHDSSVCRQDNFWILQELAEESVGGAKDACAFCLRGRNLNVACHMCGRYFHSNCLGFGSQESLSHDWSCHVCFCRKELSVLQTYYKLHNDGKGVASKNKKGGTSDVFTNLEVVQQILLNYLQEAGTQDDGSISTRWFYLCMWYKDDPHSHNKITYYLARLKLREILRDSSNNAVLSRDRAKKICLALGQKSSFCRGFDKILTLLLASLRENSPIIRAKALRAVSGIVEADPEVLCENRVQCAVEGRFCDSAISVREAALELVGRHIASHPDVGLKYFEKVAERIKDTGVSVRKRSIKIIRDLCISNADFPGATHAFIEIISRVNDEESSVQDLVCKTFFELWFEEPVGSHKHYVADGSSVPIELASKTEQVVDMLRKMSNNQHLVTIIKRNLALDFLPQSAKASGVSLASLASVRKRSELMCKRLLERILQVEELASDEEECSALPYVLALHSFCVVDPTLCSPATDPSQFVVTLQPYLKKQVDNKSSAKLLESIIFVIDSVLPLLKKPPQSLIPELEQDLKSMIVRHPFLTVVHACVKCLCSLSKTAGRGSGLVDYLVQIFSKHLLSPNADNQQLLGRSLFCLGLLLRYGYKLMVACDSQVDLAKILDMLRKYLLMDEFGLKVRALQALGNILIAKPEFMLDRDILKLIEATLSTSVDCRLKIQGLQNIYEYLLDAESQLTSDSSERKASQYIVDDTRSKVPVAAGAGDTNICGGIIQLYWNCILERCLDLNDEVRQFALKIVEIVLRQGLVHPITCVPNLIALETDPVESTSKLAHHLLMNMNEKYPSFFESRLGDGLQASFKFFELIISNHEMVSGNTKLNSIAFVRPGISRIYRLIRSNRLSRNKFIHSIVRKFEIDNWNQSSVSFLVYCTEVLASLPFTSLDEPLYLIFDINRVIQLRAGSLEANMKFWISFSQQPDMMQMSEIHHGVAEPGSSHTYDLNTSGFTGISNTPYNVSEDNLIRFQADCHDAIALQLLLRLKKHLKMVYSLSDARCQAFSLKEPPKPGETLSKQNIPFNITNTSIAVPTSFRDMVQVYQEFKTLLRDDSLDYVAYTASAQKKRPTPKSSRSRKAPVPRGGGDGDDDDEEDHDDDWTGGSRRLDFGAQRVLGGRVTRQRAQQV